METCKLNTGKQKCFKARYSYDMYDKVLEDIVFIEANSREEFMEKFKNSIEPDIKVKQVHVEEVDMTKYNNYLAEIVYLDEGEKLYQQVMVVKAQSKEDAKEMIKLYAKNKNGYLEVDIKDIKKIDILPTCSSLMD